MYVCMSLLCATTSGRCNFGISLKYQAKGFVYFQSVIWLDDWKNTERRAHRANR